jgi:glycosyltransferase involved in cell wall biosynthesis
VTEVAVNLLWCLPGRVGGSEEYVTRFLLDVADAAPDLTLVLYVVPGFTVAHPDLARRHEVVVGPVSGEQRSLRVLAERTWLARTLANRRPAIVHHAGGTAPTSAGWAPIVLSIHDVQYEMFPDHFRPLKRRWLGRAVPGGLRRARVVTAPSEFVKSTLVEGHKLDPTRVVVVPHGLPTAFARTPVDDDSLRHRYQVPGPFVLYPAATYPHKNHHVLLDALTHLPRESELRLVLIGGSGLGEEALQRSISVLGLRDRVIRTGRVPDGDRDGLLRLADAVVFPSRYEGFGAPVIEAMAAGTPVLAAKTTALPEVVGTAGLLLDPDDPRAWAAAIDEVLRDATLRDRLVDAGRARASLFTARRSAAALAVAYRLALDRS